MHLLAVNYSRGKEWLLHIFYRIYFSPAPLSAPSLPLSFTNWELTILQKCGNKQLIKKQLEVGGLPFDSGAPLCVRPTHWSQRDTRGALVRSQPARWQLRGSARDGVRSNSWQVGRAVSQKWPRTIRSDDAPNRLRKDTCFDECILATVKKMGPNMFQSGFFTLLEFFFLIVDLFSPFCWHQLAVN